MAIDLTYVNYSTTQVASIVGVHPKTIVNYCRNGRLKAYQSVKGGSYTIAGKDFLKFIYKTPSFIPYMRKYAKSLEVRAMLGYIDTLPKVYTLKEVCDIFKIKPSTLLLWVRIDYIKPFSYESGTQYSPTFRDKEIKDMVNRVPRLRKKYTDYNRRTKSK